MSRQRYAQIREQIVGRWALSNPRPTATKLAEDFGVSVKTVRSALAQARSTFDSPVGVGVHRPVAVEHLETRRDVEALLRTTAILMDRLKQPSAEGTSASLRQPKATP